MTRDDRDTDLNEVPQDEARGYLAHQVRAVLAQPVERVKAVKALRAEAFGQRSPRLGPLGQLYRGTAALRRMLTGHHDSSQSVTT